MLNCFCVCVCENESVPFIFALLYGMMLSFVRKGRCRDKAGEGLFLAGSRALAEQVPEKAGPPRGPAPAGRMGNSAQRQEVFSRHSASGETTLPPLPP